MNLRSAINTIAIIVTYNDRSHMLLKVVEQLSRIGVGVVVLVDNGSFPASQSVIRTLEASHEGWIQVCELSENEGSAGGFAKGIEHAHSLPNFEYLWLLDDDNIPDDNALQILFEAMRQVELQERRDVAVVGLRPAYEALVNRGKEFRYLSPDNSFLGFHCRDVIYKIKRRLIPIATQRVSISEPIKIPNTYYGGLLCHLDIVSKIGLPRSDFYLYGDDIEWTSRMPRAGTPIYLVPRCRIHELESCSRITTGKNSFTRKLNCESEDRLYYLCRNGAFLDYKYGQSNLIVYEINKLVYLLLLGVIAVVINRIPKFFLILKAVLAGEKGILGKRQVSDNR